MKRRYASVLAAVIMLAACTETIVEVIKVVSITIEGISGALLPGQTVQLRASARGAAGEALTGRTFTFASENPSVATISGSTLTAVAPGTARIVATAEGASGSADLTVNFPLPSVTGMSPQTILAGQAVTLTLTGTGFYPQSKVRVNNVEKPTTFVSNTQLTVALSGADVASPATMQVTVFNPTPGGGTSNSQPLSVRPANPCQFQEPYTLGNAYTGTLDTFDCDQGGFRIRFLRFTGGAAQRVDFTMASTAVDPLLVLRSTTGGLLAFNDDVSSSDLSSRMRVAIPSGTFDIGATTALSGQMGAFTLNTQVTTALNANCTIDWWIVRGATTTDALASSDCATEDPYYFDIWFLILQLGQTTTFTQRSTAFDSYLELYRLESSGNITFITFDDDSGGGMDSRIVYTPTAAAIYLVVPSSFFTSRTGSYTLTVQ